MNVQGKNFVLYVYDGGVWIGYACSLSMSYEITTEFIETSVSGTGKNATFLPTKNSFTASADGIVGLNIIGMLTYPDLQQRQLAHQLLLCRFEETDDAGNVYTKEGSMYISNSTETGSYDGMDNFSIQLRGTGEITQVFTAQPVTPPDAIQIRRYEFTAEGGETTWTDSDLINKQILEFNKDGVGFTQIITSGTPIGKEVKYTIATGSFEWGIPAEVDEQFYVLYQDL